MSGELVLVRGGGDLATGVVFRLWRSGFRVLVCELAQPLTVRRTVAVSTAVTEAEIEVEGMLARRADSVADALALAQDGIIPVLISPTLPHGDSEALSVVVDARLAKRNLDTRITDAPLVIGLGPGFRAGLDVHAVVETMRGPRLGRVLWQGSAAANTGVPGEIAGRGTERVLRAPVDGVVSWTVGIGDPVAASAPLGTVADEVVSAPFTGVLRGAIAPGTPVRAGCKIADVDPRREIDCHEISEKSLAVAGGVLEAVMTWISGRR